MNYDGEDNGLNEYLQLLIDQGAIDGPVLGITKLVIDKGEEALSSKQKYIFENEVRGNIIFECSACSNEIPGSELSEAQDNGGLCSWCANREAKMDKE